MPVPISASWQQLEPTKAVIAFMEPHGWVTGNTGGGCTALFFTYPNENYWMLTDDCSIPETFTGHFAMGLYDPNGENLVYLEDVKSLEDARYIADPNAMLRDMGA